MRIAHYEPVSTALVSKQATAAKCAAATLCLSAIAVINAHSALVLLTFLLASIAAGSLLFDRSEAPKILLAFLTYASGAAVLLLIQQATLPEYHGLTGGRGIGADDTYFFVLASPEPPLELTRLLSVSRPHYFMFSHNYSDALAVIASPIQKLFGFVHLLDLLALNISVMALLPSAVARCVRIVSNDERAAKLIWWVVLVCPFTMANSVILVRDGLTAVAFAVAILGTLERRPLLIAIGILCAAYLRLLQGALLAGSLWLIASSMWIASDIRPRPIWSGAVLVGAPLVFVVGGLIALPIMLSNLELVVGIFFREGFLQSWISDLAATDQGTSTFYKISQQPLPIRLPLAFAFYFGVPHLAIDEVIGKPIFVPRDYLMALFSVAFIAYVAFFVKGLVRACATRNGALVGIAAAYLINILVISQASMQVRHKVSLMPMFYIVVAAGLRTAPTSIRILGLVAAASVGAFMILFNAYKLWALPS